MAMRVAGFIHRRARVVGTGVIVAASIFVPSPLSPSIAAKPGPPTPFDSNGYDDSFAIAQSRPQGPLINEAEAGARIAAEVPAVRSVTRCGGRSARRWRGRSCRSTPCCSPTGG